MTIETAKQIPIQKLLSEWGINPIKEYKNQGWYIAFDRIEHTPSFKVDYTKNIYYDHGTGKGGNIIDLVMHIKGCRVVKEALEILSDFSSFSFHPPTPLNLKESGIEIIEINEIQHPALIQYLEGRKIDIDIAKLYCKQVFYSLKEKQYFAIGFSNDLGGFELRNKFFKTCSSPKGITSFRSQKKRLIILEGFFDFLSLITIDKFLPKKSDFIILNSLSFHQRLDESEFENYDRIDLFLDNDEAGKKATEFILSKSSKIKNKSLLYYPENDVNDWLIKYNILELSL